MKTIPKIMLLKRKTLIQKLHCSCNRPSSMVRPARPFLLHACGPRVARSARRLGGPVDDAARLGGPSATCARGPKPPVWPGFGPSAADRPRLSDHDPTVPRGSLQIKMASGRLSPVTLAFSSPPLFSRARGAAGGCTPPRRASPAITPWPCRGRSQAWAFLSSFILLSRLDRHTERLAMAAEEGGSVPPLAPSPARALARAGAHRRRAA